MVSKLTSRGAIDPPNTGIAIDTRGHHVRFDLEALALIEQLPDHQSQLTQDDGLHDECLDAQISSSPVL